MSNSGSPPAEPGVYLFLINQYIKENPYTRYQRKPRWALWRHGYLIHVEGDFYEIRDVASLRKTWHAMIVGAAILQGKIPALDQKISEYEKELRGKDRSATWRHVLTQSAGFDYPYGDYPDYAPGEMWTYSDINLVHLCHALAKVYGKKNYFDNYTDVAREAYFDTIGLEGWSTQIVKDDSFGDYDGVRFVLSLENMGRLGLLALNRGKWKDKQLVPEWFVKELETKQTYGMKANYNGPNDGAIGLNASEFPEVPYGYLTWVNTDQDLFKEADSTWASGRGSGGCVIMWNHNNGIVFAGIGINICNGKPNLARVIEKNIERDNPLIKE